MKRTQRYRNSAATSIALIFLGIMPVGAQAQQYTVTDLGTIGGTLSDASLMSADGAVIIGRAYIAGNTEMHGYRWENGTMTDLGTLGGNRSDVSLMSTDGTVIAGSSRITGNAEEHAYRWENGTMTDLGTLGGTFSDAILMSANGAVIAGTSNNSSFDTHGYRWENGTMTDLGTLGGWRSGVSLMSADGAVIAGDSQFILGDSTEHGYRWESGTMTDLGTLGGTYSSARLMSADGAVIAGISGTTANAEQHAFRWENGTMTDIDTLGGTYGSAGLMSADGAVIAGVSGTAGNAEQHAYRWQSGTTVDLGTLGGTYSYADLMSADGTVIAGTSGIAGDAEDHAYRWENGTMTDLGTLGGTGSDTALMSADGAVIIGRAYTAGNAERHPYRWTEDDGMVDLVSLIEDPGDWSNLTVSAMNEDGTLLAGTGTYGAAFARAFLMSASGGGGIITPEELASSLTSVASPGTQAAGIGSGFLGQSMFAARNALAGYLRPVPQGPFACTMNFGLREPQDIAPAAGDDDVIAPAGSDHLYAFYAVGSFGLGAGTNDFDDTNTTGDTGILFRIGDDLAMGVGILGATSEQDTDLGGSNRLNAKGGTMLAAYEPAEGFRAYATATAARLDLDTSRNYTNGGSIASSSGETDGSVYGVAGHVAYAMPVRVVPLGEPVDLIPYAEAEWSHARLDGYAETGGPFNAELAEQSGSSFISRVGAEIAYKAGDALTLRGRAAWGHFYGGDDAVIATVSSMSLSINQHDLDRNWAEAGLSTIWRISQRTTLSADVAGRTGESAEPALNLTFGVTTTF